MIRFNECRELRVFAGGDGLVVGEPCTVASDSDGRTFVMAGVGQHVRDELARVLELGRDTGGIVAAVPDRPGGGGA